MLSMPSMLLGWSPGVESGGSEYPDSIQKLSWVAGAPVARPAQRRSCSMSITRMMTGVRVHRGAEGPSDKLGGWSPNLGG